MPGVSPLPVTRDGWLKLLKTALDTDIIPHGSFKAPLYFFPRVAKDGSVVTNWGRQSGNTQPGKKDAKLVKQSAVLMLLTPVELQSQSACVPDLVFTLTMRTGSLRSHSGQMAFPGGRSDKIVSNTSESEETAPSDSDWDWEWESSEVTASREALEEVGVSPDQYTILGKLRPLYSSPSKSWVTPVVAIANPSGTSGGKEVCGSNHGILPPVPTPFIASPNEVESIHYLSLCSLLSGANTRHTHHHNVRYYPFQAALERAGGLDKTIGAKGATAATGHVHGTATVSISQGALTGFMLPCFYAQNAHPFSPPSTASESKADPSDGTRANPPLISDAVLFQGAALPKGMRSSDRREKEDDRISRGVVSREVSESHRSVVVMVGTTEEATPLGMPNCYQDEKSAEEERAALGVANKPASRQHSIPAKCKELHYIHEEDVEGLRLVWGLTAFMLCEFIARVTAARLVLGGWGPLTKEHPSDLTPLLSCSDIIVRDPAFPYGPENDAKQKSVKDAIAQGTYKVPAKSQL